MKIINLFDGGGVTKGQVYEVVREINLTMQVVVLNDKGNEFILDVDDYDFVEETLGDVIANGTKATMSPWAQALSDFVEAKVSELVKSKLEELE